MSQTPAEIQAELDSWYAARKMAATGKSVTITTSAGTRSVSSQDLESINRMIQTLENQLQTNVTSAQVPGFKIRHANFNT